MISGIKKIIKFLKLSGFARFVRRALYIIMDFAGYLLFTILKILHIVQAGKEINPGDIKKILLVRIDRIGDLVLTTPAITAIRKSYPEAEIHLMIKEYTKNLVINNPNINKLVVYKKEKLLTNYDLAIAFHPGMTQNYITFKSGARYRLGYSGSGGSFFLTHRLRDDRDTRVRHEVESALEFAEAAGCKREDSNIEISVTEEGENFAGGFFRENKIENERPVIIIHPGARQEYIRWKKDGFASVADQLIEKNGAQVILLEGPGEKDIVEAVASLMKNTPVKARGLNLTQVVSLIKKSDLFIGNSTGTMHIAAALKVPVAVIFGSKHPLDNYKEWGPVSNSNAVITKDAGCVKCHPGDCSHYKCMDISAEEVYAAAIGLIKENVQ
ncbi:glycosyltransferase family 9 protein [Elusimicrobiota bacterium]